MIKTAPRPIWRNNMNKTPARTPTKLRFLGARSVRRGLEYKDELVFDSPRIVVSRGTTFGSDGTMATVELLIDGRPYDRLQVPKRWQTMAALELMCRAEMFLDGEEGQ